MPSILPAGVLDSVSEYLQRANAEFASRYPGESGHRQPVHTVYGGAHLFKADTARRLGEVSVKSLQQFAPKPQDFADALGLGADLATKVHARVSEKLVREAVEDFRIDYEDGYGNRPDAEEDGHAESGAREVAAGMK